MYKYGIFDTSEHFYQANEYNEISWLLLIVLDKVEKANDKLRIQSLSLSCS